MSLNGNGESYNSLTSSLIVSSRNKMEGTFRVIGIDDADLYSELVVRRVESNELDSSLAVQVTSYEDISSTVTVYILSDSDLDSQLTVQITSYDDLDSSLNVPTYYADDLPFVLGVSSYNKMEVIYDLEEPPIITSELSPVKDTFIRSFMPKVNFGTQEDLLVGSNSQGEIYRSLLQFDISSIPKNKIIKQAELVLDISAVNKKGDIQVSPILSPWSEYGTTWDNQPVCGDYVSTGVNIDSSGSIRLDVTSLVIDWYEGNLTNNGIYLKSLNELQKYYSSYYSREGARPPKLVVKYYDPIVYSAGRSTLPSEVFIIGTDESDLTSEVEIKALWHNADLNSSVYVNIPYELPLELTVSRPSLPSSLKVAVNDDFDLSSEITVRVDGLSDNASSVSIRSHHETDFKSSVFVQYADQSDLESSVLVIYHINDLDSSIAVRGQYNEDFDSEVVVKYTGTSDIDSELMVYATDSIDYSIDSTIKVRVAADKDLDSTVTIHRKSDLAGEVMVYQKDELDSEVVVKYSGESNINSEIDVYHKSDLDGVLFVSSGQIRSELVVRGDGDNNLEGKIVVRAVDYTEIVSQIIVRREGEDSLSSEFKVRGLNDFDLPSELVPRVIGVVDIESTLEVTVIVAYPYAYIM